MSRDMDKAKIDPTYGDGLYYGPSRGHVHERYAQLIGVPRGYGYGATMGAWVLDYLANWGGERGFVTHCNARYIGPAFVGDATFLTGRVTKKESNPARRARHRHGRLRNEEPRRHADGERSGRDHFAAVTAVSRS